MSIPTEKKTVQIYENPAWFTTTTDSVLLCDFVQIHLRDKKILDIGSGLGTIPLLLSLKTTAKIYGIEIQEDVYRLSFMSVQKNKLEKQIQLFQGDIRSTTVFSDESFDLIVSNPPYFPYQEEKVTNLDEHKKYARHEVSLSFEELVVQVKKLLKDHGRFIFIHKRELKILPPLFIEKGKLK